MIIRTKSSNPILPSEITNESDYINRRQFMRATGAAGLGLIAGGWVNGVEAKSGSPLDHKKNRVFSTDEALTDYEDATTYNNFVELGRGKSEPARFAKDLKTEPWSVIVEGECEKPGKFTLEDFLKNQDLEERIYRLRCVEGWSMVIPWVGFSLSEALKRYKPTANAKYVAFETVYDPKHLRGQHRKIYDWPYVEGLRMDEAMHPLTILAVGMYGNTLPNQNGAPLRLVVPWKYGYKSIKSIVKIRFTSMEPMTTWNQLQPDEYGFYSNVNPKVPHPRWSQKRERRIGDFFKIKTKMFNGYEEEVASLYKDMDLRLFY